MKTCLINNLYPPYQKGGAEKVVELSAQELQKQGQNVCLITTKPPFSREKNNNLPVYYLRSWYYRLSSIPFLLRLFWHIWDVLNIKNYFLIKKILDQEKPDVIITHNLKGIGLLTLVPIKAASALHVHTLHDIQLLHPGGLLIWQEEKKLDKLYNRFYAWITRKMIQSPHVVISPSSWLLDVHTQRNFFSESEKKVLPNPTSFTTKNKEKLHWDKNYFYFLYAGQLEEYKGVLFLIKAFKEFQRQFPGNQAKLIIVGGGSQFKKAYRIAHPNQIIFTGKKTIDQVRGIMDQANCLIVPSQCYENSPSVIYEAIESGLPLIASDLGGIPEIARKGAARLFTPNDQTELISQMQKIQENYSWFQKMARQQSTKIREQTPKNYIGRILSFIENQY